MFNFIKHVCMSWRVNSTEKMAGSSGLARYKCLQYFELEFHRNVAHSVLILGILSLIATGLMNQDAGGSYKSACYLVIAEVQVWWRQLSAIPLGFPRACIAFWIFSIHALWTTYNEANREITERGKLTYYLHDNIYKIVWKWVQQPSSRAWQGLIHFSRSLS